MPQKPSESRSPYHASDNSHVRPNFGTSPRGAPLFSYHPSIASSYRETKMLSQVKTKSYHCLSRNGKWTNIVACPQLAALDLHVLPTSTNL